MGDSGQGGAYQSIAEAMLAVTIRGYALYRLLRLG